jgi:Ran GTPase-activating protein (RanGAP) involved in mRNA processing and transport
MLIHTFNDASPVYLQLQRVRDEDMEFIATEVIIRKKCSELWLDNNELGAESFLVLANALRNNTALHCLNLSNSRTSLEGVQALASSINQSAMKILILNSIGITDKQVKFLADMLKTNRSLNQLWLYDNQISGEGVQMLGDALIHHNVTLTLLDLSGNKLVNDSVLNILDEIIRKNTSLKWLDVSECNISEEGGEGLMQDEAHRRINMQ